MSSVKAPILKSAGYLYNFDRMVYFNRAAKKAFSAEWVEDHSDADLSEKLREPNVSGEWSIFADPKPSQAVVSKFLAEIE